jgi:hypothetical protein
VFFCRLLLFCFRDGSCRLRFVGFIEHPRNLTNQVALISLAVMGSIHVPRYAKQNYNRIFLSKLQPHFPFKPLRLAAPDAFAGSSAS